MDGMMSTLLITVVFSFVLVSLLNFDVMMEIEMFSGFEAMKLMVL